MAGSGTGVADGPRAGTRTPLLRPQPPPPAGGLTACHVKGGCTARCPVGRASELASLLREAGAPAPREGEEEVPPARLVRSIAHAAATREALKGENLRGLFQRCAAELRDLSEGSRPGKGDAAAGSEKAPLWARQVPGRPVEACSELAPPVLKHLGADRRKQWLAGLAAGKPLAQLSEAVPHGFGKNGLLDAIVSAGTPLASAAWFVKVTLSRSKESGARGGDRGGAGKAQGGSFEPTHEYTVEWESLVRAFLASMSPSDQEQLQRALVYGGAARRAGEMPALPQGGGEGEAGERVLYIARLLGSHFREGLLQKLPHPFDVGEQLLDVGPVATPVYTSEAARAQRHGTRTLQRLDPCRRVMGLWGLDQGAVAPTSSTCEIKLTRTPWSSNVALQTGPVGVGQKRKRGVLTAPAGGLVDETRAKWRGHLDDSSERPGAGEQLEHLVRMAGIYLAERSECLPNTGATSSGLRLGVSVDDGGKPSPKDEPGARNYYTDLAGAINASFEVGVEGSGLARQELTHALRQWCDHEKLDAVKGATVVAAAVAARDVALCRKGHSLGACPALEWAVAGMGQPPGAETSLKVLASRIADTFPEGTASVSALAGAKSPESFEDPVLRSVAGVCFTALRLVCSRHVSVSSLLRIYEEHPLLPHFISVLDSGNVRADIPTTGDPCPLSTSTIILMPAEQRAVLRGSWGDVPSEYLLGIIQKFMKEGDMDTVRKILANSDVKRVCLSAGSNFADLLLVWLDDVAISPRSSPPQNGNLVPFPPRVVLTLLLSHPYDPARCSGPATAEMVVHILESLGQVAAAAHRLHLNMLVRELIVLQAIEKGIDSAEAVRVATSKEVGTPANLTDVEKCVVAAIMCFVVHRPGSRAAYSALLGALGGGPVEYMLLLTSNILNSLTKGDGRSTFLEAMKDCCHSYATQLGCERIEGLDFETGVTALNSEKAFVEFVTLCVLDREVFTKQILFAGTILEQLEQLCSFVEETERGGITKAQAGHSDTVTLGAQTTLGIMSDLLHALILHMYLPGGDMRATDGQVRPSIDVKIVQRFSNAMLRSMTLDIAREDLLTMANCHRAAESSGSDCKTEFGLPLPLRIGANLKEIVLLHALTEDLSLADACQATFGSRPSLPKTSTGQGIARSPPDWVHRLIQECMAFQMISSTMPHDARPAPLLPTLHGPVTAPVMLRDDHTPRSASTASGAGRADIPWGAYEVHCGRSHSHRTGVTGPLEDLSSVPRPLLGAVKVRKTDLFFAK